MKHLTVYLIKGLLELEIDNDESIVNRYVSFGGYDINSEFVIDASMFNEHHLQVSESTHYLPSSLTVSSFLHYLSFFSDKCTLRSELGHHLRFVKVSGPTLPVRFDFEVIEEEEC